MKRRGTASITSRLRAARARIAWCMVGTAVYQVGRIIPEPGEELEGVEAGRAADVRAGVERAQHRRDQAVDVEERHHLEAAVRGRQRAGSWRCGRPRRTRWRGSAARSSAATSCPRCAAPAPRRRRAAGPGRAAVAGRTPQLEAARRRRRPGPRSSAIGMPSFRATADGGRRAARLHHQQSRRRGPAGRTRTRRRCSRDSAAPSWRRRRWPRRPRPSRVRWAARWPRRRRGPRRAR